MQQTKTVYQIGIDVGSTTTKIVALEPESGRVAYADYQRHHADQVKSVSDAVWRLAGHFRTGSSALRSPAPGPKAWRRR